MPVHKQPWASQQTKFKLFVAVGNYKGHFSFGVECSKEVTTNICGASTLAKFSNVSVWWGYWENKICKLRIVPCKMTVTGAVCWSTPSLPASSGTRLVSAPMPKKLLLMAGIDGVPHLCQGLLRHPGKLGQGHFWFHFQYTVISLLISGKRQRSSTLGVRNSLTIL